MSNEMWRYWFEIGLVQATPDVFVGVIHYSISLDGAISRQHRASVPNRNWATLLRARSAVDRYRFYIGSAASTYTSSLIILELPDSLWTLDHIRKALLRSAKIPKAKHEKDHETCRRQSESRKINSHCSAANSPAEAIDDSNDGVQ